MCPPKLIFFQRQETLNRTCFSDNVSRSTDSRQKLFWHWKKFKNFFTIFHHSCLIKSLKLNGRPGTHFWSRDSRLKNKFALSVRLQPRNDVFFQKYFLSRVESQATKGSSHFTSDYRAVLSEKMKSIFFCSGKRETRRWFIFSTAGLSPHFSLSLWAFRFTQTSNAIIFEHISSTWRIRISARVSSWHSSAHF